MLPQTVEQLLSGFKHKIAITSITEGVLSKKSSDLGLGRRPIAISDEFFERTPLSYRDLRPTFWDFFQNRHILWEHDPFVLAYGACGRRWRAHCGEHHYKWTKEAALEAIGLTAERLMGAAAE